MPAVGHVGTSAAGGSGSSGPDGAAERTPGERSSITPRDGSGEARQPGDIAGYHQVSGGFSPTEPLWALITSRRPTLALRSSPITDNALPKQAVHGRVPGPGPLVDRPNRADPNCRCFLIQEHRRSGASRALCL